MIVIGSLAAMAAGAACSGDDAAPTATPELLTVPAGDSGPTSTGPLGAPPTTTAAPDATTVVPAASAVPVVPEQIGVPGGASTNPMCRDYARVVGTQSVLTIAGAFGGLDDVALAHLELIAAPLVVEAADALAAEWPAELASEQAAASSGVIGPIRMRAAIAVGALTIAGVGDTATLAGAWQQVLDTYDPASAAVTITGLPAAVDAQVLAAATSYAEAASRYDLDASLLRTVATPLTTDYLFANCPELSYLISGDAD